MNAVLTLESGSEVTAQGRRYRIHRVCDLDSVLAVDVETNATTRVRLRDMQPAIKAAEADVVSGADVHNIPERDWEIACRRFQAIEPLLKAGKSAPEAIAVRAAEVGKDRSTLYRWLSTYIHGGTLASLLPAKSGAAAGQKRLENDVELVIAAAIEDRYLTKQRISAEQVAREIVIRCARSGLTPPHPATVRRRIAAVDECVTVHHREGGKRMQQRFAAVWGAFPGADAPLRFVQIDHTPVDLELVDDIHRRPIGRPWITVAIDVYSRMIAGFCVSFDPPGALSTGLCLAHAILPKDVWLARLDIAATWPVWGFMDAVHCDNAREFHGAMLEKACQNYGIALHFRPVRQPHYGGHIERFLGTFAARIQEAENQIVTHYEVFGQRPSDSDLLTPSIEKHQELLGRAPDLVAADAGFFSAANEAKAKELGVKKVSVPSRSTKSPKRKQEQEKRWFKKGQAWRTGCEGRISVLKRRHGLNRSRYKGTQGMQRWVGLGVIADNVINIGLHLAAKR